jgi:16S rRNA (guanine527-N7)-methyltransferase
MSSKLEQSIRELLQTGLNYFGLNLAVNTQQKIIDYLKLLQKWNKIYNLTAIHDLREMLILHVFDSLSLVPYIQGPNILDVGTGAGFPGIPLALVLPQLQFFLLDSNQKKTQFLTHATLTLEIKNVTVVQKRVEEFQFAAGFATIVTRATASLEKIITSTKHLCGHNQLLVMQGKAPKEELRKLPETIKVLELKVPELKAQRHLVIISFK